MHRRKFATQWMKLSFALWLGTIVWAGWGVLATDWRAFGALILLVPAVITSFIGGAAWDDLSQTERAMNRKDVRAESQETSADLTRAREERQAKRIEQAERRELG